MPRTVSKSGNTVKRELSDKERAIVMDSLVPTWNNGISQMVQYFIGGASGNGGMQAVSTNFKDAVSSMQELFTGKDGNEVRVYKLRRIIGTVIDKSKMKNTVTLLTPTGVINVKIYKNQYAGFDKQLSQKGADGKKHVIEKSWFSRGSLLMVQGIRRGQDFIPKKRKDSFYPVISKIVGIHDDGTLEFQTERVAIEE